MPSQEALDNWSGPVQDAIREHDAAIAAAEAAAREAAK